jgi:hypothetical protein
MAGRRSPTANPLQLLSTAVLLGSERFAALDHAIDYHGHENGGEYVAST